MATRKKTRKHIHISQAELEKVKGDLLRHEGEIIGAIECLNLIAYVLGQEELEPNDASPAGVLIERVYGRLQDLLETWNKLRRALKRSQLRRARQEAERERKGRGD